MRPGRFLRRARRASVTLWRPSQRPDLSSLPRQGRCAYPPAFSGGTGRCGPSLIKANFLLQDAVPRVLGRLSAKGPQPPLAEDGRREVGRILESVGAL